MKLYTVAEAAEIVGVSEKSIRGAISRGGLPASKLCGRIRIAKRDLKHWIEVNRVVPRAESPFTFPPGASRSKRSTGAFRAAMRRLE